MNRRVKNSIIWDLDGTLIDSYTTIVDSLDNTLFEKGIIISKKDIFQYIKENSVHQFIDKISYQYNIPYHELKSRYSIISKNEEHNIRLIPNAKEILEILVQQGVHNFIYTHKGLSACEIVKAHGIIDKFKEIVTSNDGFKRKPDPEALIYLIDKYSLEKESTYYVGDRILDVECSYNAGIKSILLIYDNDNNIQYNINPNFVINDLIEINDVLNNFEMH